MVAAFPTSDEGRSGSSSRGRVKKEGMLSQVRVITKNNMVTMM